MTNFLDVSDLSKAQREALREMYAFGSYSRKSKVVRALLQTDLVKRVAGKPDDVMLTDKGRLWCAADAKLAKEQQLELSRGKQSGKGKDKRCISITYGRNSIPMRDQLAEAVSDMADLQGIQTGQPVRISVQLEPLEVGGD